MKSLRTTTVAVAGVLVALVLAGLVSSYASSSPDGLNRVAIDHGFAGSEREHSASNGPLAGYEARGVDDPRVSGGLAGVTGSLVVLTAVGGLAVALRRRAGRSRRPENPT
jgi:hypothetical protein